MRVETGISTSPINEGDAPTMPGDCGARAVFVGAVRDHDPAAGYDATVTALSYSAHPDAEVFLRRAVETTAAKYPTLRSVWVRHRVGDLSVGDVALIVIVDAPHRGVAFSACPAIVDAIKAQVPIWKEQFYVDGHSTWSNTP